MENDNNKLAGKVHSLEHGNDKLADKIRSVSNGYEKLADKTMLLEGNLNATQVISKDERYH